MALSLVIAIALVFSPVDTASTVTPTFSTISVEKMCCQGCAQKIAGELYLIKGVKEVRVDLGKKNVYVIPLQSKIVSPRAIWEAVEKGKDNPLRLAGPSGTFTTKPKN